MCATFPLDQLHQLIAYVPQDVYLFNASVRDNILLGRDDVSDSDVGLAADIALASEFIEALLRAGTHRSESVAHAYPAGNASGSP